MSKSADKRKQRTAVKRTERSAQRAALQREKSLPAAFPDAHLPPPPARRAIIQEWIAASVYSAHTGRPVDDDLAKIWDVNWGRCDKNFLEGKLGACPIPATTFLGSLPDPEVTDRWPLLFTDLESTQKGWGVMWPEGFDLDMVVEGVGGKYKENVVNNFTLDRKMCAVDDWRTYMQTGKPPAGFEPKSGFTAHHMINNMSSLEVSNTPLADRIQLPFMQRQCDPVIRFADHLADYPSRQASLYVLSTKAGSFTGLHIDATAEVHWLTVVSGEKWVFLLPPTKHNVDKYLEGETGKARGDTQWLADQCAETLMGRVILKPGMTLVVPSRYIHAVWTPVDSLALAGGWIDEYNAPSQTDWREVEFETGARKDNRFPNYERLSWLIAEERMNAWTTNPTELPTIDFLYRTKFLLDFVTQQALRIKGKVADRSANTASSFLPKQWRETDRWVDVANGLRRAWLAMYDRLQPAIEAAQEEDAVARELKRQREAKGKKRRRRDVPPKPVEKGEKKTEEKSAKEKTAAAPGIAEGRREERERSASAPVKSRRRPVKNALLANEAEVEVETVKVRDVETAAVKAKEVGRAKGVAKAKEVVRKEESAKGKEATKGKDESTPKASAKGKKTTEEAKLAARRREAERAKKTKEGKKAFLKTLMAKPREIAAGKEQAREEVRLGKRKAAEEVSTSAKKRQAERDDSVEFVSGSFEIDWTEPATWGDGDEVE